MGLAPATDKGSTDRPSEMEHEEGDRELTAGAPPSLEAIAAADLVTELAESAVNDAKAEAAAAQGGNDKLLNQRPRP